MTYINIDTNLEKGLNMYKGWTIKTIAIVLH